MGDHRCFGHWEDFNLLMHCCTTRMLWWTSNFKEFQGVVSRLQGTIRTP